MARMSPRLPGSSSALRASEPPDRAAYSPDNQHPRRCQAAPRSSGPLGAQAAMAEVAAMAENKTKANDASVEDYIASRANDGQRADCKALMSIFKTVTKQQPRMWGPSI